MAECLTPSLSLSISKQFSCPICFFDYSDDEARTPRVLQCGHTFCTGCLNSLPSESELMFDSSPQRSSSDLPSACLEIVSESRRRDLTCPNCKQRHPRNQPISKNFQLLGVQLSSPGASVSLRTHMCEEHNFVKDIFCKDDQTVICTRCALYGDHKGHDTIEASEVVKPMIITLKENADMLANCMANVSKAHSDIDCLIKSLKEGQDACKEKINASVRDTCKELERRAKELCSELDEFCEDQMDLLEDQLKALEETKGDCSKCVESCRKLASASPAIILDEREKEIKSCGELCARMTEQPLNPIVKPVIDFDQPPQADVLVDLIWRKIKPVFGQTEEMKEEHEVVEAKQPLPSQCPRESSLPLLISATPTQAHYTRDAFDEAFDEDAEDIEDDRTLFCRKLPKP